MDKRGDERRLRIDLAERRLRRGGAVVPLRRKAFDLLALFVRHEGRLLQREEILAAVWPGRRLSEGLLRVNVSELRRALGDNAHAPRFVESVPGHGYRFLGGVGVEAPPAPRWEAALPSVAVLPMTDRTSRLGALAALAAEEVETELAQHARIRVVSSWGAVPPSGPANARAIARDLGARHLVAGALHETEAGARLHLRLVDAEAGRCLWAGGYGLGPPDMAAAARRAAREAGGRVAAQLRAADWARVLAIPPEALTAYDHLLLGESRPATSAEANLRARRDYQRAIELAPGCAPAWAGLAHSYAIEALFEHNPDYEGCLERALAAAEEACRRGPTSGKAAWVLGHVLSLRGEARAVLDAFARAERLAPRDADLQIMKVMALLLARRPEEAMACYQRAARLDPEPPAWHLWTAGLAAYDRRAYDEALSFLEAAVARRPGFTRPRRALAATLARLGRREEAACALTPVLRAEPGASLERERAHHTRLRGTDSPAVEHWLDGLRLAGLPERVVPVARRSGWEPSRPA